MKPGAICGTYGRRRARGHDGERFDELCDQDRYRTMSESLLLNDDRSISQTGPASGRTARGKYGTACEHVPDGEHDAEVDVLGSIDGVVEAVIGGTHDDPSEQSERPGHVRVRHRA